MGFNPLGPHPSSSENHDRNQGVQHVLGGPPLPRQAQGRGGSLTVEPRPVEMPGGKGAPCDVFLERQPWRSPHLCSQRGDRLHLVTQLRQRSSGLGEGSAKRRVTRRHGGEGSGFAWNLFGDQKGGLLTVPREGGGAATGNRHNRKMPAAGRAQGRGAASQRVVFIKAAIRGSGVY